MGIYPIYLRTAPPFLLFFSCITLASCGFSPLYGDYNSSPAGTAEGAYNARDLLAYIEIDSLPNREGQYLRNALIDRFYQNGYPADPAYYLNVENLEETLSELDLTRASDATRGQLRFDATLRLRDKVTGDTVLERHIRSITSYNILDSEFNTRVSEKNARFNALSDMAQQIETQIVLYFKRSHN